MDNRKSRAVMEATYDHRYRQVDAIDNDVCFYCGVRATCEDHVPPLAYVNSVGTGALLGVDFLLIPSCESCNRKLGAKPILTLKERAQVLIGRLIEDRAKIVVLPDWGDELDELTGNVREFVESAQFNKKVLGMRIANLEAIDDRLPLIELESAARRSMSKPKTTKQLRTEKRRLAVEHADACRKEHLRQLLHGATRHDCIHEVLDEYEREKDEQAMSRVTATR